MTPSSTNHVKGRPLSPTSASSPSSSPSLGPLSLSSRNITSNQSTSQKRPSSESNTNAYMSTTYSNAIPRGNGHQAMSIPMPPPPPLYFSLMPSGERGGGGGGGSASGNGGNNGTTSAGSNGNNDPANHSTSKKSIWSKKNSNKNVVPPAVSITPLNAFAIHSNSRTPRSAPTSRPSSGPPTPGGGVTGTGGYNHYHTHHHAPRSTYPLSMTHSRRSSISLVHGPSGSSTGAPDQRQKSG